MRPCLPYRQESLRVSSGNPLHRFTAPSTLCSRYLIPFVPIITDFNFTFTSLHLLLLYYRRETISCQVKIFIKMVVYIKPSFRHILIASRIYNQPRSKKEESLVANNQKQSNSQANATALTASTNTASNAKIQASMEQYGTYTATSDAHNEYPPKDNSNMNMTAQTAQPSTMSTPSNQADTMSGNAQASTQPTNTTNSTQSAQPQAKSAQAGTTLTAQYDANNTP